MLLVRLFKTWKSLEKVHSIENVHSRCNILKLKFVISEMQKMDFDSDQIPPKIPKITFLI